MERSVNIADKTTLDLIKIATDEINLNLASTKEATDKLVNMAENGELGGGGSGNNPTKPDPDTGRITITTVPSPAGSLTYNGSEQSPMWSNFNADAMTLGGTLSGTAAGDYVATFTPKEGYQWSDKSTDAKSVTWTISKGSASTPVQAGSLTYNGNSQSPTWSNYDPDKMDITGDMTGTDAGTYTVTFTPKGNFAWPDGSTTAKSVTWVIGKASISAVPTQSGTLVYNGSDLSPTWSSYDSAKLEMSGDTSGTNAGNYTAKFTPKSNYQWSDGSITAKNANWKIGKATLTATPSQSGSLTFTGAAQSPSWNNYSTSALTLGGVTSSTVAGTYKATFTPKSNYQWSDGSTSAVEVPWIIGKAAGSLSLSAYAMELNTSKETGTITVERAGDGAISASSNNTEACTVSVSGNVLTLTGKANGSATITVSVAAGTNHTAPANKTMTVTVSFSKTYGIRIAKTNGDADTRVEYTDDAVGMTPAYVNLSTGVMNYGSWADAFFVKNNYPCMLNTDGSVAYKLNPNNYAQKADGTASEISSTSTTRNAMSAIPLTYVWAYEDSSYEYIKISDTKVSNDYHAIAHTREDGTVRPEIFLSIYRGSLINNNTLRSLSGQPIMHSKTAEQELTYARANGAHWCTRTWGQRCLINYMLMIMSKSTDTQKKFGNGDTSSYNSSDSSQYGMAKPGSSLNNKGQFWGSSSTTAQVKVFHMEDWWGNQYERIAGLINDRGTIKVSLTGAYNTTAHGYQTVTGTLPSSGWIKENQCSQYGRIPKTTGGTSSTFDCDYFYYYASNLYYAIVGGYCNWGAGHEPYAGAFLLDLDNTPTLSYWNIGACLSFV